MIVRRVVGDSMQPTLQSGQVVVAGGRRWYVGHGSGIGYNRLAPRRLARLRGRVVVLRHNQLDKIKRVADIRVQGGVSEVYVTGDNSSASTDSRHYGWLPAQAIIGRVLWPIR